jgi:hypothetical protein
MRTLDAIRSSLRAVGNDELADLHDEALVCYERVRIGLGLSKEESSRDVVCQGMTTPTDPQGRTLPVRTVGRITRSDEPPALLVDVDPVHFEPDGPAHPDPALEVEILVWCLGMVPGEARRFRAACGHPPESPEVPS